jgi:diguanylate cyclase (GGDEF)-like protein
MPAVAMRVLQLMQDENVTLDALAKVLSNDPALSAKLLKLSNSTLFNLGSEVTTLQRATMVLGLKSVKVMALSFSLAGSLPTKGSGPFDFRGYWRRSLVCAVAGRALAATTRSRLVDEAFMSGLLSRIGQLVLHQCLPDAYAEVIAQAGGEWPEPELERRLLGYDGYEVGGALLRSWSLPALISESIACVEDPRRLPEDAAPEARGLVRILHLARKAEELICGPDKRRAMEELVALAHEYCGLDPDAVEACLRELDSAIAETAEMMRIEMRAVRMEDILHQAQEQLVKESLGVATEMHQVEQRAQQLESRNRDLQIKADTDALTGLAKRGALDEALATCIAERRAGDVPEGLGVLMIDVDRFKKFNDTHGHQVGDQVLQMVAGAIRTVTRTPDLAARYGGEEFSVIMPSTPPKGVEKLAERIRAAVENAALELDNQRLCVTISVGGTQTREIAGAQAGKVLIEAADRCLYQAKQSGRNRCEFCFEPQL